MGRWAQMGDQLLEDAVTAGVAGFAQALEELAGAVRMGGEQPDKLAAEGIQFAGAPRRGAPLIPGARGPFGDSLRMETQVAGNLGVGEVLLVAQPPDLLVAGVMNHRAPPARATAWRRMSPRERASTPLWRGPVRSVGGSKLRTW